MNTKTPPQKSNILKYAAMLLCAAAITGAGVWGYSGYKSDAIAHAEKQAKTAIYDGNRRAMTWCNRAAKKAKAGKVDEAAALYERCAAEPGNWGKHVIITAYMNNKNGIPLNIEKVEHAVNAMTGKQKGPALLELGLWYKNGMHGVTTDLNTFIDYMQAAGDAGEAKAWGILANHFSQPPFIDLEKAAFYRQKLENTPVETEQKISNARLLMRASFPEERSEGVSLLLEALEDTQNKDDVRSVELYDSAAQSLARYYLSGKDAPADAARAIELFDSIKNPRDFTLVALADIYRLGLRGEVDMKKAIALYEQAERDGIPFTSLTLGHIHRLGMGVPVDARKALSYYEKSRRKNMSGAASAHHLGYLYESGALGEPDYGKAIEAYEHGIARGNVTASVLMARLYERGLGVEKDEAKAFAMMSEAGLQASNLAREGLADYYTRGIGTAPNPDTARIWRDKIRPPKDPLAFICDICDPETD